MQNSKRSVQISLILTDLFAAAAIAAAFTLPWLSRFYCKQTGRPDDIAGIIMAGCYSCLPFALAILYCLHRLLKNISEESIFINQNVIILRIISFLCYALAIICLISGFFYLPFIIVAIAAAFIALIIRVIKNVFFTAIAIKDENDMTI